MKDEMKLHECKVTALKSPAGNRFPFELVLTELIDNIHRGLLLDVTGKDPITGLKKQCRYELPDRSHNAYRDCFQQLATAFGLRLPQNREQPSGYSFDAPYNQVLTDNLVPEMLYGYGDPAVIRVATGENGTCYYLVSTSNDAPNAFPICRSDNLTDWQFIGFVFPEGNLPSWAATGEHISDFWAPEMHSFNNEYRVYFVARDKVTRELCIGMAIAGHPERPFIPEQQPILRGNMIDPHVFIQDDHTAFLFWKQDNNEVWPGRLINLLYHHPSVIPLLFPAMQDQVTACFIQTLWPWLQTLRSMEGFLVQQILIQAVTADFNGFHERLSALVHNQEEAILKMVNQVLMVLRTPIFAQQLSADGKELVGERIKIMENDLPWEAHLVEGMWLYQHEKQYFLFYAGNDFSTDQYGIGVAVADRITGPFRKKDKPLLQSSDQWWAPGHPSITIDREEKPHMFLHAYSPGKAGYKQFRALLSIPLRFEGQDVFFQEC